MAEVLFTFLMQICIITTVSAIENTNDTAIQHNFKVKVTQLIEDYPHGLLDAHLAESDSNSQSSTSVPMKGIHIQLSNPQSRTKRSRFNHDNERQKLDNRIKEVNTELEKIDGKKRELEHKLAKAHLTVNFMKKFPQFKQRIENDERKEKTLHEEKHKLLESIKALERAAQLRAEEQARKSMQETQARSAMQETQARQALEAARSVKDRCMPNPCHNGGTCRQQPNDRHRGFDCICHVANRGIHCQDKTHTCSTLKCGRIKDCVASPAGGAHCICEGIQPGSDQSCLSESDQSQEGESKKKMNTTKQLIVGVIVVIVILVIATCCSCMRASIKLRDLEILYVEALDQGHVPPEEPPEQIGVCIDLVKTTICCATSSYPKSYLPLNPK